MVLVHEHEHPLDLIDMQPKFPLYEEVYDDDDDLIAIRDFRGQCVVCKEQINWFHRYYYKCSHSCDYLLHKLCAELPKVFKHPSHAHTLLLSYKHIFTVSCHICPRWDHVAFLLCYGCGECGFSIHVNCAMASVVEGIIYHPGHGHPLARMPKRLLCKCNVCGKKHEGIFYVCTTCLGFFIHSDCAFLPRTLWIQETTRDAVSHAHPLTLSYGSMRSYLIAFECRVCDRRFEDTNCWIYMCEKCMYYVHLDCATSRNEPFLSSAARGKIIRNYEDSDYPDILNLPFHNESYSIPKHLFFSETGYKKDEDNHLHPHPLILVGTEYNVACHNPMKRIELLCSGCLRPITNTPFYKCINDDRQCNFVLHEWCTSLPAQVQNHPGHPQHALTLHPNASSKFFSVFDCAVCTLPCNGFVYSCVQCDYHIDVGCSFIPEKITHQVHEGHILSLVQTDWEGELRNKCRLCRGGMRRNELTFICHSCHIYLHVRCALFLPCKIKHIYDKHQMILSYLPIEDHMSDYFCENCETKMNPRVCFYHCHECAQSMHSGCAPVILQSERCLSESDDPVYKYVNIKFGGIHKTKFHQHPLSFDQGIQGDSRCNYCNSQLQYQLIFKCLECNFAIHWDCCPRLGTPYSIRFHWNPLRIRPHPIRPPPAKSS